MKKILSFLRNVKQFRSAGCAGTRDRVRRQHLALRRLLFHAQENSAFWRSKLDGLDLLTCPVTSLPVTTKDEMMRSFNDYVTDPTVSLRCVQWFTESGPQDGERLFLNKYVISHTSGSTGRPALIVQEGDTYERLFAMQCARGSTISQSWWSALAKIAGWRVRWSALLLGEFFIPTTTAFAFLPPVAKWFIDFQRLHLLDPFDEVLANLADHRPHIISGYAHTLLGLAKACRDNVALSAKIRRNLQLVVSMSEPLAAEDRRFIAEHLGVNIADHYALGECPALGFGCPAGLGSHVNDDAAIVEVVDGSDRPVSDGVRGHRVLVTNLWNYVQPFIRYAVEDRATMLPASPSGDPEGVCLCGSRLPRLSVEGRQGDQFMVCDASLQWRELPYFVFLRAMLGLLNVSQFQVVQTGYNRFQIKLVADRDTRQVAPADVTTALAKTMKESRIDARLSFNIGYVDWIAPDEKSGKVKRFVNAYKRTNGSPSTH